MDGKSRWADNIKIERWFRSFKYEEACLTEWHNIKEARAAIREYIHTYNFECCHSAIGNVLPASVYLPGNALRGSQGYRLNISNPGHQHSHNYGYQFIIKISDFCLEN